MRSNRFCICLAISLIVLYICSALQVQASNTYIEDFSTKQYCDTLNTTAWWDTIAGELKLHTFVYEIVGTYDTPGIAWGIYVSGDYAFIADAHEGLHIMDISDPLNPILLGTYDTSNYARDVCVDGDYAFVADGDEGLKVIDISNPSTPVQRASLDLTESRGICISGDYAYIADHYSGLRIIDISNPEIPTVAANYNTPGYSYGVDVDGDYATCATSLRGFRSSISAILRLPHSQEPTTLQVRLW